MSAPVSDRSYREVFAGASLCSFLTKITGRASHDQHLTLTVRLREVTMMRSPA
jgi:hypothetical protein